MLVEGQTVVAVRAVPLKLRLCESGGARAFQLEYDLVILVPLEAGQLLKSEHVVGQKTPDERSLKGLIFTDFRR